MKRKRMETRQVLLLLPLLVLPMLAGAFYALGGGRKVAVEKIVMGSGLKVSLPEARFNADTLEGKMSVYDRAQKSGADSSLSGMDVVAERLGFSALEEDPKVAAINERLSMLNAEMARGEQNPPASGRRALRDGSGAEVEKLERLMQGMQNGSSGEDAEMKQLSSILERIQEIGDPELARLKYKSAVGDGASIDSVFGAIPAVIDGNQKAVQGSVVKLKLLDTVMIGGYLIPRGYNLYGLGSFSNQRLNLEIRNIRVGNSIIPVRLTVFDRKDAMVGINAPEALLSDAVRGGGVDAMGSFGMMGMDLTTQLAGAGIDAARGLLSKKLKRIRQPLKNGYQVLLRLEKH
ncbi:conjugative transposon protein TraM [Pedobacter sp.]